MKRRFFKKTLAVTMAMSMVVATPVIANAVESELTCGGFNTAHTAGVEVTEEGTEITFTSTSASDADANWNTPTVLVYSGKEGKVNGNGYAELAAIRSDLWAWALADGENNKDTWEAKNNGYKFEVVADPWQAWLAECKKGVDCKATAVKDGNTLTVTLSTGGVESKLPISLAGHENDTITISLTGEKCTLSDLTGTVEKSIDVEGYNTNRTTPVTVTDKTVEITFRNTTHSDATLNWHTPVLLVYANDVELAALRSDLWTGYNENQTRETVVDLYPAWLNANKAGSECSVKATKTDGQVVVTFTNHSICSKTTIPYTGTDPVYISLTGEKCTLTNIKVVEEEDTSIIKVYGGQIRTNAGGSKDLGIVSTIAKADFNKEGCTVTEMGLKVQKGDKETVIKTDYVLSGDKLQDGSGQSEGKLTADTYFFRTILTGVDKAAATDTITVTPYVEFSDGTNATGKSVTIKPATGEKA